MHGTRLRQALHPRNHLAVRRSIPVGRDNAVNQSTFCVRPGRQNRSPFSSPQYHDPVICHAIELADNICSVNNDVRDEAWHIRKCRIPPFDQVVTTLLPNVSHTKSLVRSDMFTGTQVDAPTRLLKQLARHLDQSPTFQPRQRMCKAMVLMEVKLGGYLSCVGRVIA